MGAVFLVLKFSFISFLKLTCLLGCLYIMLERHLAAEFGSFAIRDISGRLCYGWMILGVVFFCRLILIFAESSYRDD
jgi:hypothetical protein